MASPAKLYQQEMHKNLGFFATWFPGDPIAIGDVGVLENGRFRLETTLTQLGIQCDVMSDQTEQDIQYTSTEGTKIITSAGMSAPSSAKGEITIDFSREGAFVFNASGLRMHRLDKLSRVAEEILKTYRDDKWNKDWILIESLYTARRATVIISNDSSSGVTLQADAKVNIQGASLADPNVELTVKSTRGKMLQIVGSTELSPLYSCYKVTDLWYSRQPSFVPIRGRNTPEINAFEEVSIDNLLN
ncbi:hypothetical protein [Hymenobacter cavernae]|nr:hypothetical protein [Hymenobacter cavernae]